MIHLVTPENRALYGGQLEQMHQLRKTYFVEERGWSDRTTQGNGEFDDLDDEHALYLFSLEADGKIALSARLRPALDKSMLADHFPELLVEPPSSIKSPGVWELSRYFAAPRYRGPEGLRLNMELRTAVVAAALRRGARRIVAVTDVYLMNTVIRTGWEHRFLGLPSSYAHGDAIAFEVTASDSCLEAMVERHGLTAPLLLDLCGAAVSSGLDPVEAEVVARAAAALSRQDVHVLSRAIERLGALEQSMSEAGAAQLLDSVRDALIGQGGAPINRDAETDGSGQPRLH